MEAMAVMEIVCDKTIFFGHEFHELAQIIFWFVKFKKFEFVLIREIRVLISMQI